MFQQKLTLYILEKDVIQPPQRRTRDFKIAALISVLGAKPSHHHYFFKGSVHALIIITCISVVVASDVANSIQCMYQADPAAWYNVLPILDIYISLFGVEFSSAK
eukprot:scaffold7854_cov133-Chaetoceros_neogracile.AAC.1